MVTSKVVQKINKRIATLAKYGLADNIQHELRSIRKGGYFYNNIFVKKPKFIEYNRKSKQYRFTFKRNMSELELNALNKLISKYENIKTYKQRQSEKKEARLALKSLIKDININNNLKISVDDISAYLKDYYGNTPSTNSDYENLVYVIDNDNTTHLHDFIQKMVDKQNIKEDEKDKEEDE